MQPAALDSSRSRKARSSLWLAGALFGLLVLASTITRLVLLGLQLRESSATATDIARVLFAGARFDLSVSLWLSLPLILWMLAVPSSRSGRPWARRGRRVLVAGSTALALFVGVAEVIFFDEFNGRLNFVAVDYLMFPTEVVDNIWQSYHVAWLLSAVAVASGIVVFALHRLLGDAARRPPSGAERVTFAVGFAAALSLSWATTSPSIAQVTNDRALNEVAGNGYYSFWTALRGRDAPYAGLYATRPDSVVFPRLHALLSERAVAPVAFTANSTSRFVQAQAAPRPLNVVVVLEESLGSRLVGALDSVRPSLTPHFDSLVAEGTLLANAYATGNRTIRALEATTSSLPPLPGVSVVRRPQSRDLFTLPGVLREHGYATEFIYGGRALFDGMGAYMRGNGIERVVEQRDFPSDAFRTAWGVSDEAIFDRTLAELDSLHATGRPFYSLVLTVSNHKPYTYPSGRIDADPAEHRRVFAVRYADWALGRFMRQARTHAFFDQTIFVLMGDHGARVYGASEIPLPSYQVPILLYAPAVIPAGRRVTTLASSMDVPPTILSLLGVSYRSLFFGRDVLDAPADAGRAVMTHNGDLALMRGSRVAVLGLRESVTLFDRDPSSGELKRAATIDSAGRSLIEDAIAYFNGADRLYRDAHYTMTSSRAAPTPPVVRIAWSPHADAAARSPSSVATRHYR